jgi:hypothetical protein
MTETLKTLSKKHPKWKNLPIVIYRTDGTVDYVGSAGMVYVSKGNEGEDVLVFSTN